MDGPTRMLSGPGSYGGLGDTAEDAHLRRAPLPGSTALWPSPPAMQLQRPPPTAEHFAAAALLLQDQLQPLTALGKRRRPGAGEADDEEEEPPPWQRRRATYSPQPRQETLPAAPAAARRKPRKQQAQQPPQAHMPAAPPLPPAAAAVPAWGGEEEGMGAVRRLTPKLKISTAFIRANFANDLLFPLDVTVKVTYNGSLQVGAGTAYFLWLTLTVHSMCYDD